MPIISPAAYCHICRNTKCCTHLTNLAPRHDATVWRRPQVYVGDQAGPTFAEDYAVARYAVLQRHQGDGGGLQQQVSPLFSCIELHVATSAPEEAAPRFRVLHHHGRTSDLVNGAGCGQRDNRFASTAAEAERIYEALWVACACAVSYVTAVCIALCNDTVSFCCFGWAMFCSYCCACACAVSCFTAVCVALCNGTALAGQCFVTFVVQRHAIFFAYCIVLPYVLQALALLLPPLHVMLALASHPFPPRQHAGICNRLLPATASCSCSASWGWGPTNCRTAPRRSHMVVAALFVLPLHGC